MSNSKNKRRKKTKKDVFKGDSEELDDLLEFFELEDEEFVGW